MANAPARLDSREETVEPHKRASARLPRAQRVGDIETAARLVFARRGFAAASIAEIASEAGVAEGTIYKFFDSKRHLVVRVIQQWYGGMIEDFDRSLPGIVGARNKIHFIIWRHMTSLKEDRDLARLCVNEVRNGGDYYQSELHELNRLYTHVFMEACREGIANGEFRPDMPIALVRDMVFGGIEHHMSGMLFGVGDVDPNESTELITATLFGGIAMPGPVASEPVEKALSRIEAVASDLKQVAQQWSGARPRAKS